MFEVVESMATYFADFLAKLLAILLNNPRVRGFLHPQAFSFTLCSTYRQGKHVGSLGAVLKAA